MRLTVAILALTLSAPAYAQKLTLAEDSPLRVIDKTGEKVGSAVWEKAIPEMGVGNVIFSSSPLPYKQEAAYKDVGTRFDISKTPAFYSRQYQPGRTKDMIALVLAKNPEYKFVKTFELIDLQAPKPAPATEVIVTHNMTPESLEMSTSWSEFFPKSDYKTIDLLAKLKAHKGTYTLRIGHYLRFDTGRVKFVTEVREGKQVTEQVPVLRDVAVAYGECTLVNP